MHYSACFLAGDACSTQAVHKVHERGAKGKGPKTVLQSVLSVDPPDHCGRDLKGTTFHPHSDRVLLWGGAQVDHVGSSWCPLGGSWCRLDCCPDRRDICWRRGEGESLRSRRGVGGCRARQLRRSVPASWGLVRWGSGGLGCRDIGCWESRWWGLRAGCSHLVQEGLHVLDASGDRPDRLRDRVDPEGQGFGALTAPAKLVLNLFELAEAFQDSGGVVHGPCAVGPALHPVVQLALRRPNAILKIAHHAMDSRQRRFHGLMSASTLPDVVGEVAG